MKFIIAWTDYMGEEPGMSEFDGTMHELLVDLNCVDESDECRWSDEELAKCFIDGNGDGMPYYMVWCVDTGKRILGGDT